MSQGATIVEGAADDRCNIVRSINEEKKKKTENHFLMFTGIIIFCIFIIIIYGVILNIQFSDYIDFLSDLYLNIIMKTSCNKAKIKILKKRN